MGKLTTAAQSLWAKKSKTGDLLWLPLSMHLADSAAIAKKLWNRWLSDGVKHTINAGISAQSDAEQLFVFLAAAHDIGKATPVFQAKNAVFPGGDLDERIKEKLITAGLTVNPSSDFAYASKTPHALATQILLKHAGCDTRISVILGAHHGKPPGYEILNDCDICVYPENYYLGKAGKQSWTAVQKELIDYALDLAGFSTIMEIPKPNMAAQALLSGLVIMTDWIASNEWIFPYYSPEDDPALDNMQTRVQTAWKRLDFLSPWSAGNGWMGADLFQKRFAFKSNALQDTVVQVAGKVESPGILVLEAPMGSGKTEAALVAAEIFADKAKRTGVLFALPTQATSDGIFARILDWVSKLDEDGPHSIKLAHGKAQFNKDFQSLKFLDGSTNIGEDDMGNAAIVHAWFEGQKKALLADFVVGTIDQILLAALKQKHVMLRHLGLANKVVIIDECHAYDAYMSRYLDMALRWLGAYHVPVIVLSATLPAQKRQMVIDAYLNTGSSTGRSTCKLNQPPQWISCREYPMITWTDGDTVKQRSAPVDGAPREVCLDSLVDCALLDRLYDLLSDGGCAGVIVNTVKRAQELARALRDRFGSETVRLLHSQFLAPDRTKLEWELLDELGKPASGRQRPAKRIVVGTQVLEQSLDIDFDLLVTDICPMDLLLQRIGRLHRHERTRPDKLRKAHCLITGLDGDEFESGAKEIYGEYLLLRTKALLPQRLILPHDIPNLVQDVYDDGKSLTPEPAGYQQAKEKWTKIISDKEKRACDFRISQPWMNPKETLVGWLDTDVSDKNSEAAVRETDESIEVLLVQQRAGRLYLLPWMEDDRELPTNQMLEDERAKSLACQRIRLPRVLCTPWTIGKTIEELEGLNAVRLYHWQQSPWLNGELVLILDETGAASICGYRLVYNKEEGLLYEKEDGADA